MSDRHMEKAREIAGAVAGQVCDNTDAAAVETLATKLIATALAEAEREGTRRAAEIAQSHKLGEGSFLAGTGTWAVHDGACHDIAVAILSVADSRP